MAGKEAKNRNGRIKIRKRDGAKKVREDGRGRRERGVGRAKGRTEKRRGKMGGYGQEETVVRMDKEAERRIYEERKV